MPSDAAAAPNNTAPSSHSPVAMQKVEPPKPERSPLLSSDQVSREATANFLSRITYSWMGPVFAAGWRRPLDSSDIWQLGERWRAERLTARLEAAWAAEKTRAAAAAATAAAAAAAASPSPTSKPPSPKDTSPSLLRALWDLLFWEIFPYGIIRFISDLCNVFSPFLIINIVRFVSDSKRAQDAGAELPKLYIGFLYVIGIFLLQLFATLIQNYFFYLASTSGLATRTAFTGIIYRKATRLSAAARLDFTSGKVTNLVSTDCNRIEMFFNFVHVIWTAPAQIILISAFLIYQLGPAALAGIAALIIFVPLQGTVMRSLSTIRTKIAPLTDSRIRLTQEILEGIRVLKFFTWETPLVEQVESIRKKEITLVLKRSFITAFVMTLAFCVPVLAAALAFVIFGLINPLDPARIFASLSWFQMLRFPLMFLPSIIVGLADFRVALARIQALLLAPELEDRPEIMPGAADAIKIVDGEFNWEAALNAEGTAAAAATAATSRKAPKSRKWKWNMKSKSGETKQRTPADASQLDAEYSESANASDLPIIKNDSETKDSEISFFENIALDEIAKVKPERSTIRNINIAIPNGALVAIVGAVGSGKSSLLNAIVGEMKRLHGSLTYSGALGYAAQQAWIQNASVRDNILFGLPYDEQRYLSAINACALERDLEQLPDGDRTQIGERGINLSGGQKQRVNLARMVYFNSPIVLMDDPLSAVDAHVGRFLFERCILGTLSGKTRVLVTHQLHFLPKVDYVIVMRDGEIVEQDTYADLMAAGGEFASQMRNYGGAEDADEGLEGAEIDKLDEDATIALAVEGEKTRREEEMVDTRRVGNMLAKKAEKNVRELMQVEERATGTVKGTVWLSYFRAAGGIQFLFGLIGILIILQVARVGNDYWLTIWTDNVIPGFNSLQYVGVYVGWTLFQAVATYIFGIYFAIHGTRAARVLHQGAIRRVMRAPVRFFDTTPLGRIINRFSKDQDGIDAGLMDSLRMFVTTLASTVGVFVLLVVSIPLFIAPLVPVLVIYYYLQWIYRNTSRELKRLDSIARSPLYAYIGETLTGLATIRAYNEQGRFIRHNNSLIDSNNAPYFLLLGAQRWISLRFESLGALLVFCVAAFGVISRESSTFTAALLGLCLTYALQVTSTLNWCIRQFTETEIAMNAVERVDYYANQLEVEPAEITDVRPPAGWPSAGTIEFRNVSMRYAPDLPLVVQSATFTIHAGEKVAVVGRTGSGKSSLVQVLFRMIEIEKNGDVLIDGISTRDIGLRDLRSALGIIPQDPQLFSGTFRRNLDPFGTHTDGELWDALDRAGIKSRVVATNGGLDGDVAENGGNLSVGQRQLLCLARAMIKRPRVLIMDEATANVDYETDAVIQRSLRQDFSQSTVLTIAHRLNTVIDYDKVMVLRAGHIVEMDSPAALLSKSDGLFFDMVKETGEQNAELLIKMAMEASGAAKQE